MTPSTVAAEPSAATSGLDGTPARAALLFVWLTGIVHGLFAGAFSNQPALAGTAYALAAVAAISVTSGPSGRLSLPRSVVIVVCGALIAAMVLVSPRVDDVVWLFDFASYPIALLIPRGRQLLGGGGVLGLIALGTLWAATTAQPDPSWGRIVSGPFVAGAVGFLWTGVLRWIVARETRARTDRERAELLSGAALAASERYRAEVVRVADESESVLLEIAKRPSLDARALLRIAVTEGRIRDRLRAADLLHPRVVAATDAARERGIRVLLIGGGHADDRTVSDALADRIEEFFATPGLEAVTLRRLPSGRLAAISLVGSARTGVVRATYDERGRPVETGVDGIAH